MNPFIYLTITIFLEFVVYVIAIRKKILLLLLYSILINLFTWPLANLFYSIFGLFLVIELGVFIVESVLIKYLMDIKWKRAIVISLIANLLTSLVGIFLRSI